MSIEKVKNFGLFFRLSCVDCGLKENCHFLLGDLFNSEGNIILSQVDQINSSHKSCENCKNFIFIGFKKLFTVEQIRRIWDGTCAGIKEEDKN